MEQSCECAALKSIRFRVESGQFLTWLNVRFPPVEDLQISSAFGSIADINDDYRKEFASDPKPTLARVYELHGDLKPIT